MGSDPKDSIAQGTARPILLYLGVDSLGYPRNRRMRAALESQFDILVVPRGDGGFLRRATRMAKEGCRGPRASVVVLSEFSLQFAIVAWLVARRHRATLVVDWFVGMFETNIQDWREHHPYAPKSLAYLFFDHLAAWLPSIVLTDTSVRADMLRGWARRRTPVLAVPVGSPPWATDLPPPPASGRLEVLFYGSMLPLHGIPDMLRGIDLARRSRPLHLTLVGRPNDERGSALDALVQDLELGHDVTVVGPVPEGDLVDFISRSDVLLGAFGGSPKARSVVPNKVWQALSCHRRVITRRSDASKDIPSEVRELLIEIDEPISTHLAHELSRIQAISALPHSFQSAVIIEDHVSRGENAMVAILVERARR